MDRSISDLYYAMLFYFIFLMMSLSIEAWSQVLENAFLVNNAIKQFGTLVPIPPLMRSLAKAKFCKLVRIGLKYYTSLY